MIRIDGTVGSGSGSIVRVGLVISALTGKAIQIRNIRAKRPQPGLRHQHLKLVEAVAEMTGAQHAGATIDSTWLEFSPSFPPRGGNYHWEIGTAGSATLMAGTLLTLGAFADGEVHISIEGGIFQDFAPSGYHTQYCLVPLLRQMGVDADLEIQRPGYVPRGGGLLEARVVPPTGPLEPVRRTRQVIRRTWGIALSSHLERSRVSERMADSCVDVLAARGLRPHFRIIEDHIAPQPGAACAVFAEGDEAVILGADMAGALGRRSEQIGSRVARMLLEDLGRGATVDRHLADQVILPAALAAGQSQFVLPGVSEHTATVSWLAGELLGARVEVKDGELTIEGVGLVRQKSTSNTS